MNNPFAAVDMSMLGAVDLILLAGEARDANNQDALERVEQEMAKRCTEARERVHGIMSRINIANEAERQRIAAIKKAERKARKEARVKAALGCNQEGEGK